MTVGIGILSFLANADLFCEAMSEELENVSTEAALEKQFEDHSNEELAEQRDYAKYQIDNGFVLETDTGKVWKYDDASKKMLPIQYKVMLWDKDRVSMKLESIIDAMKDDIKKYVAKLPAEKKSAERIRLETKYIKPLIEQKEAILS